VTVKMIAATASITNEMAMGIAITNDLLPSSCTVRSSGTVPAKTTSATPPKNTHALAFAPFFNGRGAASVPVLCFDGGISLPAFNRR
jgi:hypothetical protein